MGSKVDKPVFAGHEYIKCRVLGRGAFGKVYAVQLCADRNVVRVVKEMNKSEIVSRGENAINLLVKERILLTDLAGCPFVVRAYAATQDEKHLFLMLEFCSGGELDFHLSTMHHMSEEFVKIYAAELVTGLDEMHNRFHIVHRDLKPENVLLDREGHITIIDFNVAHRCDDNGNIANPKNKSVGTLPYMAPEMLSAEDHSVAVDWWSLGVLLFELRHGDLPFYKTGKDKTEALRCINLEIPNLRKQIRGSEDFKDLLMGLLEVDPARRWKGDRCKNCKFFVSLNWDDVKMFKLQTPIQPDKNRINFKANANMEEAFGLNKVKDVHLTPKQQEAFVNWNWESPDQNLSTLDPGTKKKGKVTKMKGYETPKASGQCQRRTARSYSDIGAITTPGTKLHEPNVSVKRPGSAQFRPNASDDGRDSKVVATTARR
eukprot:TRINITY_DN1010_c0_g1_i1.p1 TRINITY_DN1010_c0_g1~~TRINITY_DN1010_c0_g1_i1.p1  ORF type:complete len:430 (+),score=98.08 TRINITY_DN1010_c0_g1_i1:86-1375(+)